MTEQYIGVDLHKAVFPACARQADGARLWERQLPPNAEGLTMFARAVESRHPGRRRSVRSDVGLRGRARLDGGDGVRGRSAQDAVESGIRGEDESPGRAPPRGCVPPRQRGECLCAPPAIRELREVCRGRHQLIRLRSRLAQMIRSVLLRSEAAASRDSVLPHAVWRG